MKYIKHIYELNSTNSNLDLFKTKIVQLLLNNIKFSSGDVYGAIIEICEDYLYNNKPTQPIEKYIGKSLGLIPEFIYLFNKYNSYVNGGGHEQYFHKEYELKVDKDAKFHDKLVTLFKKLKLDEIEYGKLAYDIISDFKIEWKKKFADCTNCKGEGYVTCPTCNGQGDIDCNKNKNKSECSNCEDDWKCRSNGFIECPICKGSGYIKCKECKGKGKSKQKINIAKNKDYWEILDMGWYKIDDNFIDSLNSYIKTLSIDGDSISNLIKISEIERDYNI